MLRILTMLSALFAMGVACVPSPPLPTLTVEPLARPVEFVKDVKPVLDRRCVVCHSCYNAACQLKLSSYEGIERGGSKDAVYSSSRVQPQQPTRLFLDAQSTEGWRQLGFHSVTQSQAASPANDATMLYLLEAKRLLPIPEGDYYPEATDLTCPADKNEVGTFLVRNPQQGMPFGFPAISPGEHAILETWLSAGAPGPTAEQQATMTTPGAGDAAQIVRWETFLNREDPKHAVTARYLYEHFFLAHLRFPEAESEDFFELVRSSTPPGEPISPIATVRPYDDPGVDSVYYRFRKIHSTIVYKTHMVVELDEERFARYQELFIEPAWYGKPHRMGYDDALAANPFVVYAQIPPRSRYQFLLDHSEYIIQTFMQGPVCKGQIALNVINDHFWVFFLDPDADQTVLYPDFLRRQASNLRLPNEAGSDERLLKAFSDAYRDRYQKFYHAKARLYDRMLPEGQGIDAIWPGERPSDTPMLTIYRHFDSASVHKGAVGDLPRTLWVIDYSQFERIYYALVAGFDVFGNISHQVNVRRYMDYLRMEGELNFVQFLPPEVRLETIRSWYLGVGALEETKSQEVLTERGTRVQYGTDDPKREFVEQVVEGRLLDSIGVEFDPINYRPNDEIVPMPESFDTHQDVLNGFRALTAPGTEFIRHANNSSTNVIYVRIRDYDGEDRFISMVVNRWHDNVNSLFFEKNRLDASKDTIDFIPGSVGSYPNYFLDVAAEDVPDFFDMLENFDGSPEYVAKFDKFGVNRSDSQFWDVYDWFQAQLVRQDPVRAGLYDLNRYYPKSVAGSED